MSTTRTPQHARRSSGFTLIEVLMSMAITTVLVAGMASTIYVTTRANDPTKGPLPGTIEGTRAAQLVAADVQLAQTFSTRTANTVTFTVADRDGNLTPDTIKYQWSGTPGDPLTVQYNGGNTTNLVSDVRDLAFTYKTQTVAKSTTSQTTVNSGEVLLASWSTANWPGGAITQTLSPTTVTWGSECFTLTPAGGASNLQITKVRLWLKKSLAGAGSTTVGIYAASGGTGPTPSTTQIGTLATKLNSTLTASYVPVDFLFTDVPISNLANAYNIVIKSTGAAAGSIMQYYNLASAPADNSIMKWTLNSGSSWQVSTATNHQYDFAFEVYGSYDSQQTVNTTTNRYFVRGVSVKLRVGGDSTSQVSTSSIVLNSPEVNTP